MKWRTPPWPLVQDVALTSLGIAVIVYELLSPPPSDAMLAVALALTVKPAATHVPAVAQHVRTVLAGPGRSPPGESSSGPPSPSSSPALSPEPEP